MEKGFFHPDRGYWQTTNAPCADLLRGYPDGTIAVPLKPAANMEWNGVEWVSGPPAPVEDWRETASLPRTAFCIACKRLGILPPAEAVAAARGDWPATFTDALTGLPVDAAEAQIVWAASTHISRNDPVLNVVAQYAGMTPEQVDAMFGWVA